MNKLTAKQLLMLNQMLTEEYQASDELLKRLERISKMPYELDEAEFYIYKDSVEKSAKLGCSIATIRPFEKKNTQTAILAMITLLELNRYKLVDYENDLSTLTAFLESGEVGYAGAWISKYKIKIDN